MNAQAQAYEYMTNYSESCEAVGRLEKVVQAKNSFKIFTNISVLLGDSQL